MHSAIRKQITLVLLAVLIITTGCTDYKKKYNALNVEHQNLQGLYENCRTTLESSAGEKEALAAKLQEGQQTIEQLRKQIEERNQSPGYATGFGDDYQVDVDAAAGTITVTLPNTILFSPGKATLKSANSAELNHIVSVLNQRYSGRSIDVVGHTDSDPIRKSKWKDNWELSVQRSLTVLRYLVGQGVADSSIRAVGCGQSRPIASNATASGKARNRRVEIVVNMQ